MSYTESQSQHSEPLKSIDKSVCNRGDVFKKKSSEENLNNPETALSSLKSKNTSDKNKSPKRVNLNLKEEKLGNSNNYSKGKLSSSESENTSDKNKSLNRVNFKVKEENVGSLVNNANEKIKLLKSQNTSDQNKSVRKTKFDLKKEKGVDYLFSFW